MTIFRIAGIVALSTIVLGCAAMFPFDYTEISPGPVRVGPEWTTFKFEPPMEAPYRQKGVLLELPSDAKWTDIYKEVLNVNEKSIKMMAEVIAIDGKVYQLPFVGPMGPTGYKSLYVVLLSQQIPERLVLTSVRVKASEPVELGRVLWMNSTPH